MAIDELTNTLNQQHFEELLHHLSGPLWEPMSIVIGVKNLAARAGSIFGTAKSTEVIAEIAKGMWRETEPHLGALLL